ncbi:MAG: GNAT family N-acetyltransferase [Flavobacteriaceae bacterium]|nr:GNAT family N-acetyltransferase [Flavobacteriaceae bacterium]
MEIKLKKASVKDKSELADLCIESYSKTYHDHWEDGGLAWYLEREFGDQRITLDLSTSNITYYFIQFQGDQIGFIKINTTSSILEIENAVELDKFYILSQYTGMGIGNLAFDVLLQQTELQRKESMSLCVIDTNVNAIRLYEKLKFNFHSKTRLELPFFKEELKGMYRMVKELGLV